MSGEAREDPGDLKTVAGHSIWNLIGLTLPLLLALISIPLLVEHLGKERFGVLSIVALVIGYMGVFDFGLGQAQAYFIADRRGSGKLGDTQVVFWTGISIICCLGLIFASLSYFLAEWFALDVLTVDEGMQTEVLAAFRVVPFIAPFVMLTPCLIATLEAYQEFKLINLIRIPTGASYFLAPLAVLPFSDSLVPVVCALGAGRLLETAAFFYFCRKRIGGAGISRPNPGYARRMLGFGGWMTVTNLVQPAMIHGDRFFLGGMKSLVAVTYYVTPAELIVRLLIVPRSIVTALFPNLTMRFAGDRKGIDDLFRQCMALLAFLLVCGAMLLIVFGPWALGLWLGEDFRLNSGPVLRWLAVGIVALSLAYVPQFLIQASGKPSYTGLAHLSELPLYVLLVWLGIEWGGVVGAAIAWALRGGLDLAVMMLLARKRIPDIKGSLRKLVVSFFAVFAVLAGAVFLPDDGSGMLAGSVLILFCVVSGWLFLLGREEKELLLGILRRVLSRR